jgi:hypothetical protein
MEHTYPTLFNHWIGGEHFGCSQLGIITNKATMSDHEEGLYEQKIFISLW